MKGLKLVLLSLLMLLSSQYCTAQKFCQELKALKELRQSNTLDPRADTFDVLHYWINADFIQFTSSPNMNAIAVLQIEMKIASPSLSLDLLGLNVSYVVVNHLDTLSYSRNGPKLHVPLPATIQMGDTFLLEIAYTGKPQRDAQWGGFYFSGDYAFNLGVGFAADPHNYGRVWFPCFDNFTDRATYSFNITTDTGMMALCNGLLTGQIDLGSTVIYHWEMSDPIPTYLASVAIAPYELIQYDVDGIPVILASVAADTSNMKQSFENLPASIRAFERSYGDHSFERIGFNMVPFNGGAMEHATNIAYPRFGISNGSKNYETLFAHELAHHWWGNTVTCRTQEDMWINEGWASYSERIFLEAVYGKEAYKDDIRANHKAVLHYAHLRDGEALPVSGIGHDHTYGMHVYDKGADMVHTLRGFLGDTAFFDACRSFQSTFQFQDVSTEDMQQHFQGFTTSDLSGFFNQWIKQAGFVQYFILQVDESGTDYNLRIKQNQRLTTMEYLNSVHYVSGFTQDMKETEFRIHLKDGDEVITLPKSAFSGPVVYWVLDFNERISDAITDQWLLIDTVQEITMEQALFKGKVTAVQDSALFRVAHNWVSPDHYFNKIPGVAMSKERYWTVDGIWPEGFIVEGTFEYNGLAPASNPAAGFLDNELIKITEDSLVLLYRPHAHSDWQIHPNYSRNMGSAFNKKGEMIVSALEKGQYTFGIYDHRLLNNDKITDTPNAFEVFPNPAEDEVTIRFTDSHPCCLAEVTDQRGRVVLSKKLKSRKNEFKLDLSELSSGVYFIGIVEGNAAYEPLRIVVR